MPTTLYLREISLVYGSEGTGSTSAFLRLWNVGISNGSSRAKMGFRDPSSTLSSQGLSGLGAEETIAWYLEEYSGEPFETTKHDKAASLFTKYGRYLASQVTTGGELVPKIGHLQLQVVTPR